MDSDYPSIKYIIVRPTSPHGSSEDPVNEYATFLGGSGAYEWSKSFAYHKTSDLLRQPSADRAVNDIATNEPTIYGLLYVTSGVIGSSTMRVGVGDVGAAAMGYVARYASGDPANWENAYQLGGPARLLKGLYGVGDWYGLPYDPFTKGSFSALSAVFNWSPGPLLLRGFKYGLINAVPTGPSAVYRHNTFGQFRDLLEPIPHTRWFQDGKLTESSIEITFYSRAGDSGVDPDTTNSQNLSPFATSSIPYFDEPDLYPTGRDRANRQPDIEGNIIVELVDL